MKKKLIPMVMAILIVAAMLPSTAFAGDLWEDISDGVYNAGNFKYEGNGVISFTGKFNQYNQKSLSGATHSKDYGAMSYGATVWRVVPNDFHAECGIVFEFDVSSNADGSYYYSADVSKYLAPGHEYYFGVQVFLYYPEQDRYTEHYAQPTSFCDNFSYGDTSQGTGSTGIIAKPTASTVLVNGTNVAFDAYNINDNNYFKLRDLAHIISGSEKQFEVGWDEANNAIALTSGKAYTAVGGEMSSKGSGNKTPTATNSKIYIDGKEVSLKAYNIDGNNYFKLRDVGEAFDFNVSWDSGKNTIVIATSESYTAD